MASTSLNRTNAVSNPEGATLRQRLNTASLARDAGLLKQELQAVDAVLAKAQRLSDAKRKTSYPTSSSRLSVASEAHNHDNSSEASGQYGSDNFKGLTLRRALAIEVQQRRARQAFTGQASGLEGNLPQSKPFRGGAAVDARDRELIRACQAFADTRAGTDASADFQTARWRT